MIKITCTASRGGGPEIKIENGLKIIRSEPTTYHVPAKVEHKGKTYVAFGEYYNGLFKPYTVYELTEV